MRIVPLCEAEDFEAQHTCTEEAPYLEALTTGMNGSFDSDWYPVCQRHTRGKRIRLNFNTQQELWSRVCAALEGEAEWLRSLGFQPGQIQNEIDLACTNTMLHSEFYDAN